LQEIFQTERYGLLQLDNVKLYTWMGLNTAETLKEKCMNEKISVGIIGGSGLYDVEGLKVIEEREINTPFGSPSDKYIIGEIGEKKVAFLPRHGKGHRLLPTEINYRANIFGFKVLGVERIVSVSAVGSLKEELAPTDIVIPLQFFDRTLHRKLTFFGDGLVAHIPFAHPVCVNLAEFVYIKANQLGIKIHFGGTYINIEGPAFSTKAESELYRKWGMDIIGMTNVGEARLAREAEMCFITLAVVTDYDCWHPEHDSVTVEMVIKYLSEGIGKVKELLHAIISELPTGVECSCHSALKDAIITDRSIIPEGTKKKLKPIVGKYL